MKARLAKWVADFVRHTPRAVNELTSALVGGLLFMTYERELTLSNLARVFPDWSALRRWRVAVASYRQMSRTLVESLHAGDYDDADIRNRVELDNEDELLRAHARGGGVVLLSGHYGNWEWLGRRVAAAGLPFAALYKEPKDAGFGSRLRAVRDAAGLVQIDHDDTRAAMRWVRRGGVLGIIMDQKPRGASEGAMAPLFGELTATHIGPFKLARIVDAPVFTIFCRRIGPGRYRGAFEPFELSRDGDPESAAREDAARFNRRLETAVRAHPSHWLWMYRRWDRTVRRVSEEERSESAS